MVVTAWDFRKKRMAASLLFLGDVEEEIVPSLSFCRAFS